MKIETTARNAKTHGQRSVRIGRPGLPGCRPVQGRVRLPRSAFTLVEVVIAIGIFCIMAFAVLEIVVVGLGAARALQVRHADVGYLASELAATNNILEEGTDSGDFGDFYPNARWERTVTEVGSNSLFQVDFTISEKVGRHEIMSDISILLYRPGSPKGKMSGGTGKLAGPQPVQ
jgi:prepilin-type N-terminal cleavage/methylation domain-containing protein